jgi:transmembrane sensor
MTRAHDSLSRTADQVEQEAAEWLVKVEQDGAPDTSKALAAWLGANPRHRAAFLRISTAWRRADALKRLADPSEEPDPDLLAPERPPTDESITEPTPLGYLRPPRRAATESPRRFAFAIAAALVFALVGGAVWLTHSLGNSQTYSTPIGEFHRVTLADGSSISLNTNTRVRVSYSTSQRKVQLLQGEAQFEVAHDTGRPFIVTAGDARVRAVGTEFVVRLRNKQSVDVLVSDGRVAINPPANATLVSAGEMALVRNHTVTRRAVKDITRRLAWTEGMLIFNGETLAEAVAEMNRYNRRQMLITDPSIANRTIGGAFKSTKPDLFATALEKTFGVEVRVYEGEFGSEIRLSSDAQ